MAEACGATVVLGGALMRLGRRDEAREALSVPDERAWMEAERHRVLGMIANQYGEPKIAMGEYRQALAVAEVTGDPPQLARILSALATELALSGHHDEALEISGRAVDLEMGGRRAHSLWVQRGRLLSGLGRPREALEAFDFALDLSVGSDRSAGICYTDLGSANLALGEDDAAETALREAVRLTADHLDLHGSALGFLALVLASKERMEESRAGRVVGPGRPAPWRRPNGPIEAITGLLSVCFLRDQRGGLWYPPGLGRPRHPGAPIRRRACHRGHA